MRNYSKTVGALAAASTLVAGYASANEFDGDVHVGYSNMYEFRFFDYGDSLFEAGVDLAYEAGPMTLSAGAWYGSWDTPESIAFPAGGPGFIAGTPSDELDLYAGVGTDFGPLSLELGYIYYCYPSFSGLDTQEVYFSAGVDLFWGMGLGSTAFWDFDQNDGLYVDTAVTKSFEFNECLNLDLAAGFGYADGQGAQRKAVGTGSFGTLDGFQGWYVSAQLPWEFRDGVTLTPYVKYTDADEDLASDIYGNGGQEYIIAGVKLGVAF
ncbi:hypothetical protein ACFQY0_07275 [Haloferula chungangensis]|uniref:Porin n=1 Tax=Haloferula chungangensis TaxID=1048331 RepID=A0ABW2L3P1_9BACT